ncbi:hypothetical protein P4O66_011084 [Electrophorus voltai]|uniref:Uncharacterized protein n=1 Tax=Electrophorus voltai TaxID=2609070 RepID=A0AAD8Z7S8_9TELE|nr:hypothetical protein P4O66_011084 [Electrophorus voltai]
MGNTDRRRMPGKRSKRKKGKKERNHSSPALAGKPPILLGTLYTGTTGESAPGKFWGGPECSTGSDSVESYRPMTDYQNWYDDDQNPGSESPGSYYPYWNYLESYSEYKPNEVYTALSLRLGSEVNRVENP